MATRIHRFWTKYALAPTYCMHSHTHINAHTQYLNTHSQVFMTGNLYPQTNELHQFIKSNTSSSKTHEQ